MTIFERASYLVNYFGGVRRAARALQIDVAYMSRLYRGSKINPGAATLKKLGIEKYLDYRILPGRLSRRQRKG